MHTVDTLRPCFRISDIIQKNPCLIQSPNHLLKPGGTVLCPQNDIAAGVFCRGNGFSGERAFARFLLRGEKIQL